MVRYETAERIAAKSAEEARRKLEVAGLDDPDRARTLVAIRTREVDGFRQELNTYDFSLSDAEVNRELVDEIEGQIADANDRRYYLSVQLQRIERGLAAETIVDLGEIEGVYKQARVYFGDQVRKDFGDLIAFNRAISEERSVYLKEERAEASEEIAALEPKLKRLNEQRAAALAQLRDADTFSKYKQIALRLVEKEASLTSLRNQLEAVEGLSEISKDLVALRRKEDDDIQRLRDAIAHASPRYEAIKQNVNDIVRRVIQREALLYTKVNDEGNPDFFLQIVDADGKPTSAAEGHTYGRLLCIAFDLAVQLAYLDSPYPHFVYHDGVLETFEDRKKLNLIEVMRDCANQGVQHIISVIDSELPTEPDGRRFAFDPEEVVLRLHDEGDEGRLFRMAPW